MAGALDLLRTGLQLLTSSSQRQIQSQRQRHMVNSTRAEMVAGRQGALQQRRRRGGEPA